MSATLHTCPNCGQPLAANAPEGLCSNCLGKLALETSNTRKEKFGDYELLEEIAHGGMGVVYKARQVSLNRTVAVKMIRAGQFASKEFVHRFRVEASAAAVLQHPNIVAVHEVGVHEGQHFFSMDYIAGKNLSQIVRDGPLAPNVAARYVQKIAEAIHYAHQSGILHRDLKPSNVIIDANDQPRITDFGLAKQLNVESSTTLTGEIMGTPGYMPPEQASGNRGAVKTWSDVYSIGAILYHLLTGRAPFAAGSLEETLNQVLHQDPISVRLLNPAVPRDLNTIVLKCLEKEPAKRYATAQLVADELTRFLNKEPILARPISAIGKAARWCRRKPALAGSLAAIVLIFFAGFAGVLWQWRQSERHRRVAEHNLYITDMNLSQQALKASNLGRARRLLDRHRPGKGEPDLRHWEWRYLWQQSASDALFVLGQSADPVLSVSISADGKLVAAGGQNGSIRVWDVASRKEEVTLQECGPFARVAFSPTENVLAGNASNGVVTLWNAASWKPISRLTQGSEIQSVAFSPDGKLLALFDAQGTLGLWDWAQTNRVRTVEPDQPWRPTQHFGEVAFSFDGRWLAVGAEEVRIYDVATATQLMALPRGSHYVTAIAFSPDRKHLASAVGFGSSSISVWDLENRREAAHLTGHQGWVSSLAFSSDGQSLVSGSADQTLRLWNTATWEEICVLRGNLNAVWTSALPLGSKIIASGSQDGSVLIWSASPRPERMPFQTVSGVRRKHYAPEGKMIATMNAAEFSPDGRTLAAIREDGSIVLWDAKSLTEVGPEIGAGTNNLALQYSRNGKYLAVGEKQGLIKLLDAATLAERSRLSGHRFASVPLMFLADDRSLITYDTWGFCKRWDLELGKETSAWAVASNFYSIAVSPDAKLVVTGLRDGTLAFWDTTTGAAIESLSAHAQAINGIAFSPDGRLMLTGSAYGDAKLWDAHSRKVLAILQGHLRAVNDVAFSLDGQRLVTAGSRGETLKLWDASTRQEIATLESNGEFFKNIRFSPDGVALMAGTEAGALHLWRAPSWNEIDQQ